MIFFTRNERFYFTKNMTPVRVYVNYNEKLADTQNSDSKEHIHDKTTLNGRKVHFFKYFLLNN